MKPAISFFFFFLNSLYFLILTRKFPQYSMNKLDLSHGKGIFFQAQNPFGIFKTKSNYNWDCSSKERLTLEPSIGSEDREIKSPLSVCGVL